MAMERGQRAAWLHWFAPGGLMLRQGSLVNAHGFMSQEPPTPPPAPPGAFDWRPAYGDVARSGDLGYSTGPVRIVELGRSDRYYFSVWRKQADGTWRVVLDLGTNVTFPDRDPFDDPYVAAPRVEPGAAGDRDADLAALDRDSLTSGAAFAAALDPDVRGLRWRAPPVVGREALMQLVRQGPAAMAYEPAGSDVSAAGDLGYTYGRYRLGWPATEQGVYARMWRLDAVGAWRIVYDVARPDPGSARAR